MQNRVKPEEFLLSNGIPVILQHYDGEVAATYWWVKTGSADEGKSEWGFAHFLEHMLFKDSLAKETGRASTGQTARLIESFGGDINAYTSFDQTVYHVTCAAQHWEKVLNQFGGMAKPQKFLKKDFEKEREVILEEIRKNEDSPGRQLFQTLFSTTFSKHPYGRPVIGFARTVEAANTTQLERFYKRQYVSENMGLIVVGPLVDRDGFRKKSILKILEKHFGSRNILKRKKHFLKRIYEESFCEKSQWKVKPFDVKTATVSISFRVPELEHEDLAALDLLVSVLGVGDLSRLNQRLFYQTSLVTDVSGGLYVPKDPGMVYFQAEIDSLEKVLPSIEELLRALKNIAKEGPTQEELARVLVSAESERLYASQTADGVAGRLGFLRFVMGDLGFDQRYLEELRAVDLEKIKEVAQKYFTDRRMSGVLMLPKEANQEAQSFELEKLQELSLKILGSEESLEISTAKKVFMSSKSKLAQRGIENETLPSGVRVCFYPRPLSHVFSVHASVLGGVRLELAQPVDLSQKDWGSSYMMGLTWSKGTSGKNSQLISKIIEGKAAGVEGFAGKNSVGLQMTGLARDWSALSELFTEIWIDPLFPEEEVNHARRIAEEAIRSVEDHSSKLCSKLFLETLFEKHPYGKMMQGSLDGLQKIRQQKLRAFHQKWVRPEKMVVSVSGAIKRSALDSWLIALDAQMQKLPKGLPEDLSFSLSHESPLRAPRWVERSLGREQFHILVGGLGTRNNAEDRYAIRLLQTLLGGQSGRLFIELREKRSLAYSVSPLNFEGIEQGYVGTYIACAPQKKEEAIQGIRQILEKLAERGPTQQEMKRTKEFFLGRRAMDLQSDSALAAHFGMEKLYGLLNLSEDQHLKKIHSVTAKAIQEVCRKYLVEPFQVTSVVG